MFSVKRTTCVIFLACAAALAQQNYDWPIPATIPDNFPPGINLDVAVPDPFTISGANCVRVTLALNPEHTWAGDLIATLTKISGPGAGATQTLFSRIGNVGGGFGTPSHFAGPYIFADSGGDIWAASATSPIPAGVYHASGANSAAALPLCLPFAGQPANGIWRLNVSDNAQLDTGTIAFARLTLNGGAPLTGACCTNQLCSMNTQSGCLAGGGAYFGDGSFCTPTLCIPVTGACCINQTCNIATHSDCLLLGGAYFGDGTFCTPMLCLPMGACCINGTCGITTQPNCFTANGTYFGDNSPCTPMLCTPMGACCTNGSCSVMTQPNCLGGGGSYLGDATTCAGNPCAPVGGACCLNSGSCSQQTAAACSGMGGTYQGDGTMCATANCPPGGRCCLPNGLCTYVVQSLCNGAWDGAQVCPGSGGYGVIQGTAALDDISVSGVDVPGATGDDGFGPISIGFTFTYFGSAKTSALVSTNGYLTFGSAGGVFTNTDIPNPANPNDAICPFWDDLFVTAPESVKSELRGAAPNRRRIVQWTNVHHLGDATVHYTFQAILYETSNIIEFRYGAIGAGASITIGIEDSTGATGIRIGAFNAAGPPAGVTSIQFIPTGPCPIVGACCGIDGICQVTASAACADSGGTYLGDGTSCINANCPPGGACCMGEACVIRTQTACTGSWLGPNSSCGNTPMGMPVTFPATAGLPAAIPDAPNPPLVSLLDIADSHTIASARLQFDINHPAYNQLRIVLVHEDWDVSVVVVDGLGGGGGGLNGTYIIDDAAPTTLDAASGGGSIPPGAYRGDNPMSLFQFEYEQGRWRLEVQDLATGTTGVLNNWAMILDGMTHSPCLPTGACCLSEGLCLQTDMHDCHIHIGSMYHGDGTTCAQIPIPCGVVSACCSGTDCQQVNLPQCHAINGAWSGPAQVPCSAADCQMPCMVEGDMNHDGNIDGDDIPQFCDCLLTSPSAGRCACGDMTGDRTMTLQDLIMFVQLLLNQTFVQKRACCMPAYTVVGGVPISTCMELSPFNCLANGGVPGGIGTTCTVGAASYPPASVVITDTFNQILPDPVEVFRRVQYPSPGAPSVNPYGFYARVCFVGNKTVMRYTWVIPGITDPADMRNMRAIQRPPGVLSPTKLVDDKASAVQFRSWTGTAGAAPDNKTVSVTVKLSDNSTITATQNVKLNNFLTGFQNALKKKMLVGDNTLELNSAADFPAGGGEITVNQSGGGTNEERVTYTGKDGVNPNKLIGVVRGARGTKITEHAVGQVVTGGLLGEHEWWHSGGYGGSVPFGGANPENSPTIGMLPDFYKAGFVFWEFHTRFDDKEFGDYRTANGLPAIDPLASEIPLRFPYPLRAGGGKNARYLSNSADAEVKHPLIPAPVGTTSDAVGRNAQTIHGGLHLYNCGFGDVKEFVSPRDTMLYWFHPKMNEEILKTFLNANPNAAHFNIRVITPTPGSNLGAFTRAQINTNGISVTFTDPVTGVVPQSLTIGGIPAAGGSAATVVNGTGAGAYVFKTFNPAAIPLGVKQVKLNRSGIKNTGPTNLAPFIPARDNPLAADVTWTITVNP